MRSSQQQDNLIDTNEAEREIARSTQEIAKLRESNNDFSKIIEKNKESISEMDARFIDRKSVLKHLEYDVNVIEKEGRKLAKELNKVMQIDLAGFSDEPNDLTLNDSTDSTSLPDIFQKSLDIDTTIESVKPGSPAESGASSSGNSSELRNSQSTPDLPILTDPQSRKIRMFKGDNDAENSDTGLSSLHSSSDEAATDFGTLV